MSVKDISEYFIKPKFHEEKMNDLPAKPPATPMQPMPIQDFSSPVSIPTGPQHPGTNAGMYSSVPQKLTARDIHQHIRNQMRYKRYYSITTTVPQAPFIPLPTHPQMETRPCHPSTSRIHTLTCGHTVAVPRSAEPCATNCVTRVLPDPKTCINAPILPQYTPLVSKMRNSIQAAVNDYANTFNTTDTHLDAKAIVHVVVLKSIWARQDQRLAGNMDLLGGEFACKKCKSEGQRAAMPAFMLAEQPYFCIVVGREEIDMRVIEELDKGVLQEPTTKAQAQTPSYVGPQVRGGYAGFRQRGGYAGFQPRGEYGARGVVRQGLMGRFDARFDARFNRYQHQPHPYHTNYNCNYYMRQNGRGMHVPFTPRAHGAGIGKFRGPPRSGANVMSPRHVAIVRFRENEKQSVLGRLKDENLVEGAEGMDCSG